MWQPTSAWSLILVPAPWRLDSLQNCLFSSLGQNYCFLHGQPATYSVSSLLDVKQKRKAEAVMGDIFTPCQGGIFLLKVQNSFLIQSRSLGVVKVDALLKNTASDKTNRSFPWEQNSQKDYSAFILGRLYSVKDRSRIMSCDCKSHHVQEKDIVMCHFNQGTGSRKGICLLPCQGEISLLPQHSRYRFELAGSDLLSGPPE